MSDKKTLVTANMTVAEIVEMYPSTVGVLGEYGLSCAACHIGAIETIEEGALSHGFSPAETENLIDDLNDIANEDRADEESIAAE